MPDAFDHELLTRNLTAMGLELSSRQIEQLELYAALLVEWNQKMNLTAITAPDGIAVLHFADSFSLLSVADLPAGGALLDVGTGAGFPAIPLLIARPDLRLTMMDSLAKRLTFIETVLDRLGLNAVCIHSRAEDAARQKELREQFDVVTARAVAAMNVLAEYCLPYVKVGGTFAAMKGPQVAEELAAAKAGIGQLGGKVQTVHTLTLSDGSERGIALIRKVRPTPPEFPRHGSKISKKPL